MRADIFITTFILIIGILTLYLAQPRDITFTKSSINNETYLVRKEVKQESADMLAIIWTNIMALDGHLIENKNKYPEYVENIEQMHEKLKTTEISESSANSKYTSYSVNKGERIVFCLRSKETNELHDINLLMYVVLHELAHVATPEYGHTPLFKKVFAFLTTEAIKIGLYRYIDFDSDSRNYCGMEITDSII